MPSRRLTLLTLLLLLPPSSADAQYCAVAGRISFRIETPPGADAGAVSTLPPTDVSPCVDQVRFEGATILISWPSYPHEARAIWVRVPRNSVGRRSVVGTGGTSIVVRHEHQTATVAPRAGSVQLDSLVNGRAIGTFEGELLFGTTPMRLSGMFDVSVQGAR